MFEEICLVCGKHLADDGLAYCSDDCQHTDLSSPSISSSSSALSSPNMGYAAGGEVPALMPSALGSALQVYAKRSGYRVTSSSASSNSWSAITDDEDEDAIHQYGDSEFGYKDPTDPSSKSANFIYSINPSALSYARRPSGTNNHSTVPHVHRRLSSASSSRHLRGFPRSAPISSHALADDEESYSDLGFSSSDSLGPDEVDLHSEKDWGVEVKSKYSQTTKPKRSRNRASLPACFSLLQMNSSLKDIRSSPVSSSSGKTIARPSPPTPKLSLTDALSQVHIAASAAATSVYTTPRGRRREADNSRSSRRSGHSSPSRSRSRERRVPTSESPGLIGGPLHVKADIVRAEEPFDWNLAAELPRRGREVIRRNSSPPSKFLMGPGMEDPAQVLAAMRRAQVLDRSQSGGSRPRTRGRTRVEDLDCIGLSNDAPGFGNGRSGILDRERGTGPHIARVPL
ncbi:hypothetical protein GALMADRAFT_228029 [Galerina marginata CBS 339.88]|uniref:Uncharacterized protein n=1 Tax=Galerina marginata (strain CBS 339.88) TaxID=685588 RepID=A0A067T0Y0_GALM3|nr:hypothetical protein GALMADRAFT_228029 [Galerina marginata CBS 339.88]